jgi:hypothetical protein
MTASSHAVPLAWKDFRWALLELSNTPYRLLQARDWFRVSPLETVLLGLEATGSGKAAERQVLLPIMYPWGKKRDVIGTICCSRCGIVHCRALTLVFPAPSSWVSYECRCHVFVQKWELTPLFLSKV